MSDAEPAWVLWTRGLRGPEISVLRHRGRGAAPQLYDREKQLQLAAPVRLRDGDELLPLSTIERLYPAPKVGLS